MVHLDASALIDSLAGERRSYPRLRELLATGERMALACLVLYEWRRGPRTPAELAIQEDLFPSASAIPFGPEEAARAADLYRSLGHARARATDLAIAACALVHDAALWTINPRDFADVPGLRLVRLS